MSGIVLRKLSIIGEEREPASITFNKGLNLVSGPSNTGKSYIFDCINYMLGGSEKPEKFKENKGYTKALLEIESEKKILTLERELTGGDFKLYQGKISEINILEPTTLKSTHEAGALDNISGFLLNLSGFSTPTWLKKNKQNKKYTLSFRNLKNYITVNEERIITKESPAHSGQYQDITLEKSLLKLLITGTDDSNLEENEKPEIKKAKLLAKLDVLDELISDTKREINNGNLNRDESVIKKDLDYLKSTLDAVNQETDNLNIQRKVLWEEIKAGESKIIYNNEILIRFNLLEEQYLADINRLKFIDEGVHYFNQLNVVKCPNCGYDLHNDSCGEYNDIDLENINDSCTAEINKIQLNLYDLRKSKTNLQNELEKLDSFIKSKKGYYSDIVKDIEKILEPKSKEIQNKLDSIMQDYKIISELETLEEKLNTFLSKYEIIENMLKNKATSVQIQSVELDSILNNSDFKNNIFSILQNWSFEDVNEPNDLTFNIHERGKIDIAMSDKERKSYGKGYRALIYSAFVIALMKYCGGKNLPHPGFVILDSPVTTFHDVKVKPKKGEDESIPLDKQSAFFNDLSQNYDKQIIILENKEPEENIKEKINYIEFTKDPVRGRYGFFNITVD